MPAKAVARFWMLMGVKYAQKWTSQFTDDITLKIAQDEWAKELACFSMDEIKQGLERCTNDHPSWPPTIGEFKLLCKCNPAELGLPTAQDAWQQICTEGMLYTHGVVLAACKDSACDVFNWRMHPRHIGVKLFEPIYKQYVQQVANGVEFDLPVMLEDKVNAPVTWSERKQHANNHIAAMRKKLKHG